MEPKKTLSLPHLIRPDSGKTARPPALFMLHGYGSDEEDLFSFARELPEDLFVISLQAPYRLEPFGHAWYAIDFNAPQGKWNNLEQAETSRELVLRTIEEAIQQYGLDPDRINLLGFSQGSILSYALALSYPERIKSVIALSGYIDKAMLVPGYKEKDLKALQIYASHGQVDMVIPVSWAQRTSELLESLKIEHLYEEYPVGHGVSPKNLDSFKTWMADKY